MKKKIIDDTFKFEGHYILWATGSQVVLTALTGGPPVHAQEYIYFYSAWNIVEELDKLKVNDEYLTINSKHVLKVASLTRTKRHYHSFPGIENVVEPRSHPDWSKEGYNALLGRKRTDGALIGYLLWLGNTSYVMGIWPIVNSTRYEQTDKSEVQKLFRREIKDFTKPKLWRGVYLFTQSPK